MYCYPINATEEEKAAIKAEAERHAAQFGGLDYYSCGGDEEPFFMRHDNGRFTRSDYNDPDSLKFGIKWYVSDYDYNFEDIWTYTSEPEAGQLCVDRRTGRIVSLESDDLPEGSFYIGGYEFEYAPCYNDDDGDYIYSRDNYNHATRRAYTALRSTTDDDIDLEFPVYPVYFENINHDLEEIAITTDCPEKWVVEWAGEIVAKLNEIMGQFEATHEGDSPILVDGLPIMGRNEHRFFQSESSKMTSKDDDEAEFARYLAEDYKRANDISRGNVWPVFARIVLYDDWGKVMGETITYNVYDDERDYQRVVIGEFIHELTDYINELLAAREETFGALA